MTRIERSVSFPLDGVFLRRQCPLCGRQFKVELTEEERTTFQQAAEESYMVQSPDVKTPGDAQESLLGGYYCPYCGQQAAEDQWWTEEQAAYLEVVVGNIAAELLNQELIRPLKRLARHDRNSLVSLRVEADELRQQEEWVPAETDDMTSVDLPCCERAVKIEDDWAGTVHCFFCGFPHRDAAQP